MGSSESPIVVALPARRVASSLASVAFTLVAISLVFGAAKAFSRDAVPEWLGDLFSLNQEGALPAFFSGGLLLISSGLFATTWFVEGRTNRRRVMWLVLAAVFMFLSFDELFAVHERLVGPMNERFRLPDFLRFAWVLVYLPLVAVVAVGFWRVWLELPHHIRKAFAAAAVVYLTGAVGFEMVSSARYTGNDADIVYGLIYTVEETLEMVGLILLIYALLSLLGSYPTSILLGREPGILPTDGDLDSKL